MARGGVRSSRSGAAIRRNPFVPWVGGFPINRPLPALSEQHEPAGKIELSYRFPFARARARARTRVWKTCVSPMRLDDASLLIDGDASKTFKIVRRNRRKEAGTRGRGRRGEAQEWGSPNVGRRDRERRIAFTYENGDR